MNNFIQIMLMIIASCIALPTHDLPMVKGGSVCVSLVGFDYEVCT